MRFRVGGLLFAGHVSGAGLDLGGTADAQRATGAGVGHQVQVAVDLASGVAPGEHDVAIAGAAPSLSLITAELSSPTAAAVLKLPLPEMSATAPLPLATARLPTPPEALALPPLNPAAALPKLDDA